MGQVMYLLGKTKGHYISVISISEIGDFLQFLGAEKNALCLPEDGVL